MAEFDKELDVTGYTCPVPIFRTHKALNDMKSGEILRVITSDPRSEQNMVTFTELNTQFKLVSSEQDKGIYYYLIKKI